MEQASTFSRTSPSPRYRALVALYKEMHEHGEQAAGRPAEKTYAGMSCRPQAPHVKAMVEQYGARTILAARRGTCGAIRRPSSGHSRRSSVTC